MTSPTAQYTDFSKDVIGRYVCNGLDEALRSTSGTFRAIRHRDPEWQAAAGAIAAAIQHGLATSFKSFWLTEATR